MFNPLNDVGKAIGQAATQTLEFGVRITSNGNGFGEIGNIARNLLNNILGGNNLGNVNNKPALSASDSNKELAGAMKEMKEIVKELKGLMKELKEAKYADSSQKADKDVQAQKLDKLDQAFTKLFEKFDKLMDKLLEKLSNKDGDLGTQGQNNSIFARYEERVREAEFQLDRLSLAAPSKGN